MKPFILNLKTAALIVFVTRYCETFSRIVIFMKKHSKTWTSKVWRSNKTNPQKISCFENHCWVKILKKFLRINFLTSKELLKDYLLNNAFQNVKFFGNIFDRTSNPASFHCALSWRLRFWKLFRAAAFEVIWRLESAILKVVFKVNITLIFQSDLSPKQEVITMDFQV